MTNPRLHNGGKKRKLQDPKPSTQLKKVKLSTKPPFKTNCNLLIELPNRDYDVPTFEKYMHVIDGTNYVFINNKMTPNELLSLLNAVFKSDKYIKCNLILDNYHATFRKPFHHYKNIKIVKCLMSELILSSRFDIYNVKINKSMVSSIIPLIHSINFTRRKTLLLDDFKKIFDTEQPKDNSEYTETLEVDVTYKSSDVQSMLKDLITKHKKQAINTIKLKEKQAFEKLVRQKEKRKRLEGRKIARLAKQKLKKPETKVIKKVERVPEVTVKESSEATEKSSTTIETPSVQVPIPKVKEEILTDEELDKHALLTITKNMSTLTTLKKTKPYKIVKIFIKLPIKKFSTTIINEMIANNKTSANIVMVSYINLQDTKLFFKNELKMKELGDSTEREFKVLAIGGGINDVLLTLTGIRKAMMMKMAK